VRTSGPRLWCPGVDDLELSQGDGGGWFDEQGEQGGGAVAGIVECLAQVAVDG
jgi:hypothetical protein